MESRSYTRINHRAALERGLLADARWVGDDAGRGTVMALHDESGFSWRTRDEAVSGGHLLRRRAHERCADLAQDLAELAAAGRDMHDPLRSRLAAALEEDGIPGAALRALARQGAPVTLRVVDSGRGPLRWRIHARW